MRIVVTGASGFIGSNLCRKLRSAGHDVVAAIRESSDRSRLNGTETRVINLLDQATLRDAFAGAGAVVHCAAITDPYAGPWEARAVTWIGTFNVCHAAVDSSVSHLVQMSTTAVYARDIPQGVPLREDSVAFLKDPRPYDTYSPNKAAAERCVTDFGRNGRLATTVVRAPIVFGPGDHLTARLVWALRNRRAFYVGSANNRVPMIFVDDLVSAIAAALMHPGTTRDYHVAGFAGASIADVFNAVAAEIGVEVGLPVLPYVAAHRAAAAFENWWIIRKREGAPPLNRILVETLGRDLVLDTDRAQLELAWRPQSDLRQPVAETVAWAMASRQLNDGSALTASAAF